MPSSEHACFSELKRQRQLDRARAADLVERVEAAVGPARAEAASQCLRRVTKLRTRQVAYGRAEVRVVEDVEELSAEAKRRLTLSPSS